MEECLECGKRVALPLLRQHQKDCVHRYTSESSSSVEGSVNGQSRPHDDHNSSSGHEEPESCEVITQEDMQPTHPSASYG